LLQQYPATTIFRALVKESFGVYWEANLEGKNEIVQRIVDRFPPNTFFKLMDGALFPVNKKGPGLK
jgi:hypothetical protein